MKVVISILLAAVVLGIHSLATVDAKKSGLAEAVFYVE